ncbi:Uncharacterized protein Adt_48443 [Abeliophyllum distichum]|uniref:Uncharacterized protein n=1 Tax=Abeliophyllum distichum TaxID=126358 RepID=A0ABD1NR50_9LAMI
MGSKHPIKATQPCTTTRKLGLQPPIIVTYVDAESNLGQPHNEGAREANIQPNTPRIPFGRRWRATRCVTPRQTCPQHNGFGRNLRSKTRWSHGILQFTPSIAFCCEHTANGASQDWQCCRVFLGAFCAGGSLVRTTNAVTAHVDGAGFRRGTTQGLNQHRRPVCLITCSRVCLAGFDNDPSAGSPTETLLRLLLPLNDKVQWTSRDVAGSKPPTSPRSEHFTGPFNR